MDNIIEKEIHFFEDKNIVFGNKKVVIRTYDVTVLYDRINRTYQIKNRGMFLMLKNRILFRITRYEQEESSLIYFYVTEEGYLQWIKRSYVFDMKKLFCD